MFLQDTKPDEAAADAAKKTIQVQQNPFLGFDETLTWFRREHPEAHIITDLKSEGPIFAYVLETRYTQNNREQIRRTVVDTPDPNAVQIETRQAVFAAEILIDGEIVARGHGSAMRVNFASYLEKAESIAIRRACIHAGYSLEMIQQCGLASPPKLAEEKRSNPPATPVRTQPAAAAAPAAPPAIAEAAKPPHKWAHLILSGEASNEAPDINTPAGCVAAVPIAERRDWRKQIAETFEAHAGDFLKAVDELAPFAAGSEWKWIVLLQAATKSEEVNRILVKARMSGMKPAGKAWSIAGHDRAAAVAFVPE